LKKRLSYFIIGTLLALLLVSDGLGIAGLGVTLVVLVFSGVLLAATGMGSGIKLQTWFATRKVSAGGSTEVEYMRAAIHSAASGNQSSRKYIANLLASVLAMRTGAGLRPDYDSMAKAREELISLASDDSLVQGVVNPPPLDQKRQTRTSRNRGEAYLAALRTATNLVRGRR
jgi:hypothetical protein